MLPNVGSTCHIGSLCKLNLVRQLSSSVATPPLSHKAVVIRGYITNLGALVVSWLETRALDLESQGLSPTSVRAFCLFPPLLNLNALEFTQLYPIK